MEASDILKIAYELFRVKEDRFIMSCEDDRANLFRSLDTANAKIAELKVRMAVVKQSYDNLFETVQNNTSSGDKRKSKSSHSSPSKRTKSSHIKVSTNNQTVTNDLKKESPQKLIPHVVNSVSEKEKENSHKLSNLGTVVAEPSEVVVDTKQDSPRKTVRVVEMIPLLDNDRMESSHKKDISHKNVTPVPVTTTTITTSFSSCDSDMPIDQEWIAVEASHPSTGRSQNGKKAAPAPDADGFLSIDRVVESKDPVVVNRTSSGGKTLRKHQSCVELPTHVKTSSGSSLNMVQKQNQLQIAPKTSSSSSSSSRVIQHRSVSSHPSTSSSRYGESLVIAGRKGLSGGVTTTNKVPFAAASTSSTNSRTKFNILTDNYKCVDVVRNKSSRDALPGHTCDECEAFYTAMVQQGVFSPDSKKARLQECSRHKSKWSPPRTPEGFWDLTVNTPEEWK